MSVMPGAVWRPITIPGGNPGARSKGRGVVLHVAASESVSLWSYFNNNAIANSHFFVNRAGVIEQYVDTDLQAWASLAANRDTISVETQGGATNADTEPWTPAQVAALGRICAWAHATEGIPLAPMTDSLPTSRGIGYHRLGIDPWRIAGGQVWSSSRGKLCPGAAKIAQVPAVIAAAQAPPPAPTPQEIDVQLTDQIPNANPDTKAKVPTTTVGNLLQDVQANAAYSARQTMGLSAALTALSQLVAQQNGLTLADVSKAVADAVAAGVAVHVDVQPGSAP